VRGGRPVGRDNGTPLAETAERGGGVLRRGARVDAGCPRGHRRTARASRPQPRRRTVGRRGPCVREPARRSGTRAGTGWASCCRAPTCAMTAPARTGRLATTPGWRRSLGGPRDRRPPVDDRGAMTPYDRPRHNRGDDRRAEDPRGLLYEARLRPGQLQRSLSFITKLVRQPLVSRRLRR
jgi:hypothetical protein